MDPTLLSSLGIPYGGMSTWQHVPNFGIPVSDRLGTSYKEWAFKGEGEDLRF